MLSDDEHSHADGKRAEPLAVVGGEILTDPPHDVYIPPDALRVLLDSFEGPLDLLLHLIRKKNIDILDLPIAEITAQYMAYISVMRELQMEIASEYLVMASTLAEIKSRMLLPRVVEDEDEEDPRAELARRLLEYTRYKRAAEDLDALPRLERDQSLAGVHVDRSDAPKPQPEVSLGAIEASLRGLLRRTEAEAQYQMERETFSVKERIGIILSALLGGRLTPFAEFCRPQEGRGGVVVTMLAVLDLLRAGVVDVEQEKPYAPMYLRRAEV